MLMKFLDLNLIFVDNKYFLGLFLLIYCIVFLFIENIGI